MQRWLSIRPRALWTERRSGTVPRPELGSRDDDRFVDLFRRRAAPFAWLCGVGSCVALAKLARAGRRSGRKMQRRVDALEDGERVAAGGVGLEGRDGERAQHGGRCLLQEVHHDAERDVGVR